MSKDKEWTLYFDRLGQPLRCVPQGEANNFKHHTDDVSVEVIEVSAYLSKCAEIERLRGLLDDNHKFFREICFTEENNKIIGISRGGAVRAFNRHVYIARKLLYGKPYTPPIDKALEEKP